MCAKNPEKSDTQPKGTAKPEPTGDENPVLDKKHEEELQEAIEIMDGLKREYFWGH